MSDWLAIAAAAALAQLLSLGFVFFLYCIPAEVRRLPRDAPLHVVWRSVNSVAYCVVAAPLLTVGGLVLLAPVAERRRVWDTALFLAPHCHSFGSIMGPVASIAALFFGPLLESALRAVLQPQRSDATHAALPLPWTPLSWLSNPALVRSRIVAPITEEWVFRCCTFALFRGAGAGLGVTMLGMAVSFGSAHVHHYLERRREGWSRADAALHIAIQFAYTAVFGSLVTYYLSFGGSFIGIAIVHSFCNTMGLPSVMWLRRQKDPLHAHRWLLAGAFVAGIVACAGLTPALAHSLRGPCAL